MIKQDINQYNTNNQKHGYWEKYYFNGNLWFKGNYVNGERHGYWEEYYYNGKLDYKCYYINGKECGLCEEYNNKTFYI